MLYKQDSEEQQRTCLCMHTSWRRSICMILLTTSLTFVCMVQSDMEGWAAYHIDPTQVGPQGRVFSIDGTVWGVACSTPHYKNIHLEGPQGRVFSSDGTVWGVACSTLHVKKVHLEGPQGRVFSSDGRVWGVASSAPRSKRPVLAAPRGHASLWCWCWGQGRFPQRCWCQG